jgi:predicted RNA-binding Zn-ribbon protein involved in translation (DUF1610 family)
MNHYICPDCYEEIDGPYAVNGRRVTKAPACPACGSTRVARVTSEREKGDDDGVEYGDPRDERDERRGL